jgi:phosphoribosylformimino-5-aminoimidazole carboxamide ribotide isomerase
MMLLIPAIDLKDGRCVRLLKGDFNSETRYECAPQDLLRRYRALGAPWLHVVDLDGARDGVGANSALVLALASAGTPKLQVGGGVRSAAVIERLLAAGIERVVVGSAAIEAPQAVGGWLARFGSERVCLAFDVRLDASGVARVHTHGWTRGTALELWEAIEPFRARGLKHVLCTDIDRDGALAGPNLALYAQATRRFPDLAWQASGGVRHSADLTALAATGVAAALSGKALLEGHIEAEELQAFLPNASLPASTSATAAS